MHPALALVPALVALTGQWPVPGMVTAPYAPPIHDWQRGHRGVDLMAAPGDPVRSMRAGTVAFVGVIGGIPVVTVRYPGGTHLRSTYEPVTASVEPGQPVGEGALIGTVAAAGGHCAGRCVHVGLRTDTRYLDPALLLRGTPAILKPAP